MGDEDHISLMAGEFLRARGAPELFGGLDFKLKDGFHFSQVRGQLDGFSFIEDNERSLKVYYKHFFNVDLETGGEGKDKYYYLDFNGQTRGPFDVDHRQFIKNEFIIVGFLLYKVVFIDKNIGLSSVRKFQETLRRDYEDLKPDLYRLLAKTKRENASQYNDQKLDDIVMETLKEFDKIGWVSLDEDELDIFPAFHRLNKVFGDYINDIDNIIRKMQPE
jgi:chromosome condensin MukBEF MukE localization factor